MDTKTINWRDEIIKMFPETTERVKGTYDEWCPRCHGLGLIKEDKYIRGCTLCYGTGVIVKTCVCGNKIEYKGRKLCDKCREEQIKREENKRFEQAKKVDFKDYRGKFLWDDRIIDPDDLEEELYDLLSNGEDPPKYIYGTRKEKVFSYIDLYDVVYQKCEDGYEDMVSFLNFTDNFKQAQEYLNKWVDEQGDLLDVYWEDKNTVVLLDDLIEKLKAELKNDN